MRKLLAAFIILIAIILLLPFGFGLYTQHLLTELDGLRVPIKEGTLGALEINVVAQQRGWFQSKATVNVSYEEPSSATVDPHADTAAAQAKAATLISSEVVVTHGPILGRPSKTATEIFTPTFGQAWIAATVTYAAEDFENSSVRIDGLQNTSAFGLITLTGSQKVLLNTHELSIASTQGQLTLAGLELAIERLTMGYELIADFQVPQLDFVIYAGNEENSGMHLQMNNVNMDFAGVIKKIEELWFGTWQGEAIFSLDSLKLDINGDHIAANHLLSASLQVPNANKQLLDGEGEVDIANITFNNQSIGPIEMAFSYANIDKVAVEYMRGAYNEWLYSDNNQPFFAALTPEQHDAFYAKLLEFVNYMPSYQIDDLDIITPQGNFISDFAVSITEKATDAKVLQNTDYWKKTLNASLDVLVAKDLLHASLAWSMGQFYSWINPLVSNAPANETTPAIDYSIEADNLLNLGIGLGILQPADDEFASNVRYDQGVLTVNEKTMLDFSKSLQQ